MALHRTQPNRTIKDGAKKDLTNMSKALSALALLLVLLLAAPSPSFAQGTDAQRRAAIADAMDQAGGSGKVLSVKPYKNKNGQPGFRIRILSDGTVRTFDVAAEKGS